MNKNIKVVLSLLAVLLAPMIVSAQTGTALTSTTLSSKISAGGASNIIQLASVTGISGFGPGINSPTGGTTANGNITDLYVDRELMQVVSVNTNAKTVVVIRGQGGSQASPHASGAIVIIGPPQAFIDYDPEGYCGTIAAPGAQSYNNPPAYNPWINQRTSNQWICSTVTVTWVPGFGNPGVSGTPIEATTTVAISSNAITPSGILVHVTGTTVLKTITLPATYVGGPVTLVFDGSGSGLTWDATGNISVAGTSTTAGSAVTFVYDSNLAKWVPSRLA